MPSWDSIHPLIVHFPIALLMVAPVLVLIGLFGRRVRGFLFAGLVVMALGTAGAWLAVASGEAAAELAERTPGIEDALEQHEEMGEATRTIFTLLTAILAVALFWPRKAEPDRVREIAGLGAFLAVYAVAAVYLALTAHHGGLLVHQHGIHAPLAVEKPIHAAATSKASPTPTRAK